MESVLYVSFAALMPLVGWQEGRFSYKNNQSNMSPKVGSKRGRKLTVNQFKPGSPGNAMVYCATVYHNYFYCAMCDFTSM